MPKYSLARHIFAVSLATAVTMVLFVLRGTILLPPGEVLPLGIAIFLVPEVFVECLAGGAAAWYAVVGRSWLHNRNLFPYLPNWYAGLMNWSLIATGITFAIHIGFHAVDNPLTQGYLPLMILEVTMHPLLLGTLAIWAAAPWVMQHCAKRVHQEIPLARIAR